MSMLSKLLAQMEHSGPPPCKGCGHYTGCANRELACDAFVAYVHGRDYNRGRKAPSREQYAKIYMEEVGPGRPRKPKPNTVCSP